MLEVCPAYTDKSAYIAITLQTDSGVNDRLVKLRSLIDQTSSEFIEVSYIGAVNFLPQNTVFCEINHISVYCVQ